MLFDEKNSCSQKRVIALILLSKLINYVSKEIVVVIQIAL
jgi:hypothetical protein